MITVRPLEQADDLSTFNSGNATLDGWVKKHGLINQRRFGVTYVAVEALTVLGFATVAASSIARHKIGGRGPEIWPVLLLGRMAVARDHHGHGIGRQLLIHVFQLAAQQHLLSGCSAVVVDSKPEAVAFYQKYGFKVTRLADTDLPSPQTTMYLAMDTVLDAIAGHE